MIIQLSETEADQNSFRTYGDGVSEHVVKIPVPSWTSFSEERNLATDDTTGYAAQRQPLIQVI